MPELSEADRYLLEQISQGNSDGWSQLVDRYQGRLLAFARGRLARKSEAEDLVQDTFVTFLQSIKSFNRDYSLETFLFTILRRKIIDLFRGRQMRLCFLQETMQDSNNDLSDASGYLPGKDQTASWYMGQGEANDAVHEALSRGLGVFLARLRENENFRDLQIIEMILYAQLRNKDVARVMNMDEKQIALIKHRALNEVREHAKVDQQVQLDPEASGRSLLTEVWEEQRFTCPKRSTVGRYLLNTLE
ncbi:MAG: RNA polymerase sigma factor, partial [Tepidisphaeraceae bacterium]